jgi:hypothetical protein
MKKTLIILLTVVSTSIFAQRWTKLPNSDIKFSDFQADSNIKWKDYSFEYFLKGDRMLSISKGLSEDFKTILTKNPEIFDDIFANVYNVTEKNRLHYEKKGDIYFCLDSIAANINFKTAVILSGRKIINQNRELVWEMSNPPGTHELGGWYMRIVFKDNGKKRKYLRTMKGHMIL